MGKIDNPCFRCGKQRVVVKVSKELINGSLVTTTTTTCPDPECQKLLNKQMEKDKNARERLVGLSKHPVNSFGRQRRDIVLGKKVNASRS